MDNFKEQIGENLKGAGKSIYRFPAAIVSGIIVSVATIIKISIAFETENYNFLLTSIQLSFLLSTVSSMAFGVFREVEASKKKSFFLANILGPVIGIISFLLLYFFGGIISEGGEVYLSNIAGVRVGAGVFISIVAFIYIISKSKFVDSFSSSFFITHRGFTISALYGLVIMLGVSGVLGAFQTLLYEEMSFKIYQYLGVLVGFLTFSIFLGYFPRFKKESEEKIEAIESQPRFIFILFEYILTPIMIALTVVLLVWSGRVILEGIEVSFNQLSGIASSYIIVGIWLHIMLGSHKTKLANFYKRAYPFAGVLILIFQAWALWDRIGKFGLQTAEYSFLILWIFAVASILLLISLKEKAYRKIAIIAAIISVVSVLPIIGYQDITFNSQVKRLEKTLKEEELLVDGDIVSGSEEIEAIKKGKITSAVDFISFSEKKDRPEWFKKDLDNENVFKVTFGFAKTYGVYADEGNSINIRLKDNVIDISDYSKSLNISEYGEEGRVYDFETDRGNYEILVKDNFEEIPGINIKFAMKEIYDESMEGYIEGLLDKYPIDENRVFQAPFEDMHIIIELEDVSILLVVDYLDIYSYGTEDANHNIEFRGVFVKEN